MGFRYWVHEPVWVTQDPERDEEEMLRQYGYIRWKYTDMATAEGHPSDRLRQPPAMDDATRAAIRRMMIYGSPEQVADQVRAFGRVLGEGGQLVARSYYPGLPFEQAAAMIELLGQVKQLL
jgi:alkanesulfonate monooxygenase SsuD/methylene tetrahydromethanopterin reductase-like flavin-dependent oxidoreductase (luciferase family)